MDNLVKEIEDNYELETGWGLLPFLSIASFQKGEQHFSVSLIQVVSTLK